MSQNLFSVQDKVVLVTGAARGNGQAIAQGFHDHGALVYLVDRSPTVAQTAREITGQEQRALVIDLCGPDAARTVVDWVVQEQDRLDVLVNNAGITIGGSEPYSDQLWQQTLAVNLQVPFELSRQAAEVMKHQSSGMIINITSLGGRLGFPDNPAYQASKAGLAQLTRAMARDWGRHGIRVNSICPGYILTSMTRKSYEDPQLKAERSSHMILDRWGRPDDLVGPCIFLCSEAASYITGAEIPVDGGWLIKGL